MVVLTRMSLRHLLTLSLVALFSLSSMASPVSTDIAASADAIQSSNVTQVALHSRRFWLWDWIFGAPLPQDDSFYKPPGDFASKPLGTVLKSRDIKPTLNGILPSILFLKAHQVLYRTQDINGNPIAAVTTIMYRTILPKKNALISMQVAYDSTATKCQPSNTYRIGGDPTLLSRADGLILYTYLLLGYTMTVPDYEGPDAAFPVGRLEGVLVLDAIRATQQFAGKLPSITDKPLVLGLGYSGGGIATSWAAGLQPTYAPELNMKGWVIGGVVPNVTAIINHVTGTWANGFLPVAFNGFGKTTTYGAPWKTFWDSILTPRGRGALEWAEPRCTVDNIVNFAYDSVLDPTFQTLGSDLLKAPPFLEVNNDLLLGASKNETPTAPVLLYHGGADPVTPFPPASKLNDDWCENGASVRFSVYESGGHIVTPILALLETIEYTAAAFSSKVSAGCTKTSKFDLGVDKWDLDPILKPIAYIAQGLIDLLGVGDEKVAKDVTLLQKA